MRKRTETQLTQNEEEEEEEEEENGGLDAKKRRFIYHKLIRSLARSLKLL